MEDKLNFKWWEVEITRAPDGYVVEPDGNISGAYRLGPGEIASRIIPGQVSDEYLLPECADEDDYVSRSLELMETSGYDLLAEMGYERRWE